MDSTAAWGCAVLTALALPAFLIFRTGSKSGRDWGSRNSSTPRPNWPPDQKSPTLVEPQVSESPKDREAGSAPSTFRMPDTDPENSGLAPVKRDAVSPGPMESKRCTSCAEDIRPDALICKHCGRKQPDLNCPKCGAMNFRSHTNCRGCAESLGTFATLDGVTLMLAVLYCAMTGLGLVLREIPAENIVRVWYSRPLLTVPFLYVGLQILLLLQKRRMPTWSTWVTLFVVVGLLAQALDAAMRVTERTPK